MTQIKQECLCYCGPYKGYSGRAEYDSKADLFHGEVTGTRDVITFQGHSIREVGNAFCESVDDYLDFCASRGEQPEKPFSGKFMVRIAPQLHRKASQVAERAGKSLNQFVGECLAAAIGGAPIAGEAFAGSVEKPRSTKAKKLA